MKILFDIHIAKIEAGNYLINEAEQRSLALREAAAHAATRRRIPSHNRESIPVYRPIPLSSLSSITSATFFFPLPFFSTNSRLPPPPPPPPPLPAYPRQETPPRPNFINTCTTSFIVGLAIGSDTVHITPNLNTASASSFHSSDSPAISSSTTAPLSLYLLHAQSVKFSSSSSPPSPASFPVTNSKSTTPKL
ncbi:hypothetical protein IEQ34_003482 [Dendrobium chrysotoxum]|uniref:Uncharacterized protein n=1 Tax=Dendrobium chrysotoxum TaxID=161865 RepID=A0AAV7H3W1_DENCH|nr:hypothetical protein IEQ34_003482 [Dendrobium chrysotoxum]